MSETDKQLIHRAIAENFRYLRDTDRGYGHREGLKKARRTFFKGKSPKILKSERLARQCLRCRA
jgi:hypothetical protein